MSVFTDFFDELSGKAGREEGIKRANQENIDNQNQAAAARVFAETEGMGVGNVGHIAIGADDDEDDEVRKRRALSQPLSI